MEHQQIKKKTVKYMYCVILSPNFNNLKKVYTTEFFLTKNHETSTITEVVCDHVFLLQIIISFAKIVIRAIRPHMEVLGRIEGTEVFCSIRQYPMVVPTQNVLLIRIDCSFLCFVNANFIRER